MQITGLWMSRSLVTLPTFRAENSEPASLSKTLLTTLPTMRQRISRNLWRWRVCWFFHNLLHARRLEAWKDYTPWRVLDRNGDRILIQWRGYSRGDASWEDATDFPQLVNGGG